MQRSRRTVPPYIRNLIPSPSKKGMFDITWHGITYTMPLELAQQLSRYFQSEHSRQQVSVAGWLRQLPQEQQALVSQSSGTIC